ncbi:hypothetical protein MP228_011072 [Amoeboaphelidium protococcarum]|nr:hypothetical protein MP228_011072 [Amoeboaphelidium protococcarum]
MVTVELDVPCRVIVNMDDPYTHKKIVKSIQQNDRLLESTVQYDSEGLIANIADADICWAEYEQIPHELVHTSECMVNCFTIRKSLIRKANFVYAYQQWAVKNQDAVLTRHIPRTFILQMDHPDYYYEMMDDCWEVRRDLEQNSDGSPLFIIKPSMANKAAGITILSQEQDLIDLIEKVYEHSLSEDEEDEDVDLQCQDAEDGNLSHIQEWAIQDYIRDPLLGLNGQKKFHLRVYVLAVGRLQVYLYNEFLALFALNEYSNEPVNGDPKSHITNTCVQQNDADFVEENQVKLWSQLKSLHSEYASKFDSVSQQIADITADVFKVVMNDPIGFQPRNNAFEWFGLDFVVDSNWHAWYLEANAFPDFGQTGSKLSDTIQKLVDSTFDILLKQETDKDSMKLIYQI